jgi:hypothetical protein
MIKTLLTFLIAVVLLFNETEAQNLVSNPGYETVSSCPSAQSQLSRATGWSKPPGSGTTPDLFHSCHPGGAVTCTNVDLPGGWAGNIVARTGNSAAGVLSKYDFCGNCREYIQTQLTITLTAGTKYNVEYYVICPPTCKYETNGLDCYIGNQISQPGNQPITAFVPQINSPLVTKSMGWTLVSGTYTANGTERFITLGNFRNDAGTLSNTVTGTSGCALTSNAATYLFDDVSVQEELLLDGNLLLYEVEKEDDKYAYLEWSVSNPQDYEHLIVQRSEDGINFRSISEPTDVQINEFTDLLPQPGTNYYRLRLKNYNGTVEMTSIKSLNFEFENLYTYSIYPNPFEDLLNIELYCNEAAEINFSIINVTGQLVYAERLQTEEGRQVIMVNTPSTLTKGAYYARIEYEGTVQFRKLIKR